jgi:surface protein
VTNFGQLFSFNNAFNQNIGSWNVSKSSSFYQMFYINEVFNNGGSSSINNWQLKTTGTISMDAMFSRASSFNQPIGNWNTIAVNNMIGMFQSVTSVFNQNIGNWNVSNVLSMSNMLNGAKKFNNGGSPSIGNWDTSSCLDMSDMFRDNEFNQNIGAWNVSKVNSFYQMFAYNNFFNNGGSPSINNWQIKNTGTVSMQNMFFFSTAFNQPIGNWNISNVTNFANFMSGKTPSTFSAVNLDAIYNGWSLRPVKTPITISFGAIKYTAASSAGRAILTGVPNNWVITDGGI